MKYKYPKNIDVISGFGINSDYELQCQKMVIAGMKWFDDNPEANPMFSEINDVYGISINENDEAKSLSKTITKIDDGCPGAMRQAVTRHILYAHKNGWDKYIIVVTEKQSNEKE